MKTWRVELHVAPYVYVEVIVCADDELGAYANACARVRDAAKLSGFDPLSAPYDVTEMINRTGDARA